MSWRRVVLLDLILVAVLVAGVIRIRQSWKDFEKSHRVETVQPEKETIKTLPVASVIATGSEDWTDIGVRNPFSFDRNDIAIVAPKQAAPAQPKPVLFGTMALGNERIAMLGPGQTGSQASRPVKVGESIGTWQVVEIQEKAVIVVANGVRETVILNDPSAQVPRSMVRTISGSAPPPQPVVVNTAAPQQTAPATANTPAPAGAPQTQPTQTAPTAQPDILHTLFGDVPRVKP
jgi:hypothetical protein